MQGKDEIAIRSDEIEKLKEELEKFKESVDGKDINYFVFHYDKKKNPVAYLARITEDIGEKFAEGIKNSITDFINTRVVSYDDNDSELQDGVEVIRSYEVPNAGRILEEIEKTNFTELDKATADNTSGLKFAVRCKELVAFGSLRKTNLMEKSKKGKIITINESGTFVKFHEDVLYEIPDKYSSFKFKDYIIISNELTFESIFNYHEKIIELVRTHSTDNQRLFSDEKSFIEMLERDSRKARKMYFAVKGNYISSITPSDIMHYASKYNLDIKPDNDGKVDIENSNIWHVVNAINEDYYTGTFSKSNYASRNKQRLV